MTRTTTLAAALLLFALPLVAPVGAQDSDPITVEAIAPAPYSQLTFTGGALAKPTFSVSPAAYWNCSYTMSSTGGSAECVPALRGAASCVMTGVSVHAAGTGGSVGGNSTCGAINAVCQAIKRDDTLDVDRLDQTIDTHEIVAPNTSSCYGYDYDASLLNLTPWRCEVSWPWLSTQATGTCILNDP